MTTYTKKLVHGSLIVFVMSFLTNILAYFLRIILARNLTQEEYGLIYAVFALFGLFSVFQYMGLREALVKFISEFRVKNELEKIKTAVFISFAIQAVGAFVPAVIGILLSGFLADHYFKIPAAKYIIIVYAVSIALSPVENLFLSIFQGYQKMSLYSLVNFLRMVFLVSTTWLFIYRGFGVYSVLIAYILVYILSFVIYFPVTLKKIIPDLLYADKFWSTEMAKELLKYGFPIIMTAVAGIVLTYTDTAMITYFQGLEQTALYNAAVPTSRLLWIIPQTFLVVLFPIATELWFKNKQYLRHGALQLYKYCFAMILPVAFFIVVYSEFVLKILFGQSYEPASRTLQILAVGGILFSIASINGILLGSIGRPELNSRVSWLAAVFNFLTNIIVIPIYGISGAAFSTVFAFALMLVATVFYIKREIGLVFPWKDWIKTIVAGLIFLTVIEFLKENLLFSVFAKILISGSIALFLYVVFLFVFRVLTMAEIRDLLQKSRLTDR